MLKVQVISRETIRPSSPTPRHLDSVHLSVLDQIAPHIYTHLILFYSPTKPLDSPEITAQLKASLSHALVHFYPYAGSLKVSDSGIIHVECNDQGIEFVEAHAEADLASILRNPPIDQFNQLLPIKESNFRYNDPLLALQLTHFAGGGHTLGVSISHLIADGASMAAFLTVWANIARGLSVRFPPRFDSALVFPPQPGLARQEASSKPEPEHGEARAAAIKRFVLGPGAIERLRRGETYMRSRAPTRVEAVSALVWRCLLRARGETVAAEVAHGKTPVISHVVNLRSKIFPALSSCSVGNLWINVPAVPQGIADCSDEEEQGIFEEAIRSAVKNVDEGYAMAQAKQQTSSGSGCGGGESVSWIFSSWCRMPFYETDFGWGDPAWVGCGLRDMKDVCILMDTKAGDGIEVWLWLAPEKMESVEKDPEFLSFISID